MLNFIKEKKRKEIWLLLTLLWMGVIFVFSTDVFSHGNTLGVLSRTSQWFRTHPSPLAMEVVNYAIRKCAHVISYLLLFLLTARTLDLWRGTHRKNLYGALIFCIFYAVTDEYHQSFTLSRSMEAGDVLWDALGAGLGMGIYLRLKRKVDKI